MKNSINIEEIISSIFWCLHLHGNKNYLKNDPIDMIIMNCIIVHTDKFEEGSEGTNQNDNITHVTFVTTILNEQNLEFGK